VRDLSRPLEECLEAMQDKRNLQDVLRRYPADRDELIGMLRLSVDLSSLGAPAPDPAFRLRARNRMLAEAVQRRHAQRPQPFARLPRPVIRLAFAGALAVALLVGGLTAAAASDNSLPGDPLYGVKLGVERVQLTATLDSAARARLQLHYAELRLSEAQRLFALGRAQEAVRLVSQYDAAVAEFSHSVSTNSFDNRAISELSRLVEERRVHDDASLNALAGSLSQRGDRDGAAAVARTQSHVDQALNGSNNDLQAHSTQKSGQPQDTHAVKPPNSER
jgi:Domain of unknown function (DUF5667)